MADGQGSEYTVQYFVNESKQFAASDCRVPQGGPGQEPSGLPEGRPDRAKRFLDIIVASAALVLTAPVLVVAAFFVYFEDGGPVFFLQPRTGRYGRVFQLLKLRSMRVNRLPLDTVGQVKGDHYLVTRVGRVLRRLKLDELPQLLNVVKGEMSVVGPRPTVPEATSRYTLAQARRLLVRPGMTGWAQVNGNIELSWDDRILLDIWYVDHRSLALDVRILARTIAVVLFGERPNRKALAMAQAHANRFGWRS
jgi:lipopolysaccharide/colanic/teichoic acid biosynthesis glycosyltransferase